MTATLTENGKTVGFLTFSDINCNCPNCGTAHEITDKMEDRAFKTKRGTPVFKCACGVKLEAFYCPISKNYKLYKYLTAKDWKKYFKERSPK